jgi:hypothetical protein
VANPSRMFDPGASVPPASQRLKTATAHALWAHLRHVWRRMRWKATGAPGWRPFRGDPLDCLVKTAQHLDYGAGLFHTTEDDEV